MSNRIDANFTEDAVSLEIQTMLTLLSFPELGCSVEPFSRSQERTHGADARIFNENVRGFRPFYMQFKRPSAYPDFSAAKVIKGRKRLKLGFSPRSLFFPLRDKRPEHEDFQHNILYRLRQSLISDDVGDATYICPLFLDRSSYRFSVNNAGRFLRHRLVPGFPWALEDVLVHLESGSVAFDRVPVLLEHVSIPPHDLVIGSKHSYSFDERGADVCFHSPMSIPDGGGNLAKFLLRIQRDFQKDDGKITADRAIKVLKDLVESVGLADFEAAELSDANPIGSWLIWGDFLQRNYGIEQYAFVRWRQLSGPF